MAQLPPIGSPSRPPLGPPNADSSPAEESQLTIKTTFLRGQTALREEFQLESVSGLKQHFPDQATTIERWIIRSPELLLIRWDWRHFQSGRFLLTVCDPLRSVRMLRSLLVRIGVPIERFDVVNQLAVFRFRSVVRFETADQLFRLRAVAVLNNFRFVQNMNSRVFLRSPGGATIMLFKSGCNAIIFGCIESPASLGTVPFRSSIVVPNGPPNGRRLGEIETFLRTIDVDDQTNGIDSIQMWQLLHTRYGVSRELTGRFTQMGHFE